VVSRPGRSSVVRNIGKIYSQFQDALSITQIFTTLRSVEFINLIQSENVLENQKIKEFLSGENKSRAGSANSRDLVYSEDDDVWMSQIGVMETMENILSGLERLRDSVLKNRKRPGGIVRI